MRSSLARSTIPFIGVPYGVIPIYGTTLIDILGYTLMIPLLPAFAERYGASDVMVGALLSVPALCSTVAAPIWGKVSDRLGRKSILLVSQIFSLAGYLLLALSHSLLLIFLARIISGFGAGNLGAAQSYIADVTPRERRGEAYAIFGVIFGAGFIVGPVASGFLMQLGVALPFFLAAALEVINLAFTSLFLPSHTRATRERTSLRASLRAAISPRIRRLFIRQFLFIFAVVYFLANFALYLHHVLYLDTARASWLLATAGLIGAGVQLFGVAPLARLIGERRVGQVGLVILTIAYALLFVVSTLPTFLIMLALWAIGAAMVQPTLMALLSQRAPQQERGAIMGVSDSISSIALIIAPVSGSAFLGYNAHLLGLVPMCAMLAALWFGRFATRP